MNATSSRHVLRGRTRKNVKGRKKQLAIVALVAGVLGTTLVVPANATKPVTTRISRGLEDAPSNGLSSSAAISADGNLIAYQSMASNLVEGDTNNGRDVFVYNRDQHTTTRVSVDSVGQQAPDPGTTSLRNTLSGNPSISADGRYVAFESDASNLVADDTNTKRDIFVHDMTTGVTQRVSVTTSGAQGTSSHWSFYSYNPEISADGRYVAFQSGFENLVTGDTNLMEDVFVHDRVASTTTRVSVNNSGAQLLDGGTTPSISGDGRYVTFTTYTKISKDDGNANYDIYVRDRVANTTSLVSMTPGKKAGNGISNRARISSDGRYIAFESAATNLLSTADSNGFRDVFLKDRTGATPTTMVSKDPSQGQFFSDSILGDISANGSRVSFGAMWGSVTEVFLRDTTGLGITAKVSSRSDGVASNGTSTPDAMTPDGSLITFESNASNLAIDDNNAVRDIFLAHRNVAVSPLQQWVAMGDSYSSGQGAGDYEPGTDTESNQCRRSANAYPKVLSQTAGPFQGLSSSFVACNGATTENVIWFGDERDGEPLQIAQPSLNQGTDVVTLTIGGNDIGWSSILEDCLLEDCATAEVWDGQQNIPYSQWLATKINSLANRLSKTVEAIRDEAPSAVVLVAGYPQLFPHPDEEECGLMVFWQSEQPLFRDMTSLLNSHLETAAVASGAYFIDAEPAFEHHEVCGSQGEWIQHPYWDPTQNIVEVVPGSFHPTTVGQQAYADLISSYVSNTPVFTARAKVTPEQNLKAPGYHSIGSISSLDVTGSDARACTFKLSGDGFKPRTPIKVKVTSGRKSPSTIAKVRANADGTFHTRVNLTGHGMRELNAVGRDPWNQVRRLVDVVTIQRDC